MQKGLGNDGENGRARRENENAGPVPDAPAEGSSSSMTRNKSTDRAGDDDKGVHSMRSVKRLAKLPKGRIALLLFAGLAALLGLAGALVRANITDSLPAAALPDSHGVLMVFGFLGTAISLERAVAYRGGANRRVHWCFAAPLLGGLGTLALLGSNLVFTVFHSNRITTIGHTIAGLLWIASMAALFTIYAALYRRQPSKEVLMQMLASFVGLVGVVLWTGEVDATVLAPMWLMFLVLTIVGERVELARAVFSKPHVESIVLGLCLATVPALIAQCLWPSVGYPILGLAVGALMIYMAQHDVARATWHNSGLTGFMGVCMLSAYAWGLFAAFVWLFAPVEAGGYWTDMGLHALALGFIVTMVIAHASVIIPSVTRRPMPFHPVLWACWIILQAGLVLRLAGTIKGTQILWQVGDAFSVIGMLAMMVSVLGLVVFGRRILENKRRHRSADSVTRRGGKEPDSSGKTSGVRLASADVSAGNSPRLSDSARSLKPAAFFCVVIAAFLSFFAVYALEKPSGLVNSLAEADRNGSHTTSLASSNAAGAASSDTDLSSGVSATRHTTRVGVGVKGMAFVPGSISLPAGDRLVITFGNTGDQRHNLTFANGKQTGNVAVGEKATLDVGVIGADTVAWCALAGHRQMGMELKVHAVGGKSASQSSANTAQSGGSEEASSNDVAVPSAAKLQDYARSSQPFDASVPRDEFAGVSGVHERRYTFDIRERKEKLSDGVTRTVWSYDKASHQRGKTSEPLSPGPVLRGRVGDTFRIHLVNQGSMSHSIDFHAGPASPQEMMHNIEPGKSLDYTFAADHAGIWLYHCSSEPMSNHIANGMYGAVIIEPDNLPAVDAEYVLVGSEIYLGANESVADSAKVAAMKPDIMTFNGRAFQYDSHTLPLKAGGRVRIWVLDAGPNMPLSFHIVGTQFDTVWSEGRYLVEPNGVGSVGGQESNAAAQVLALEPAQGGFVETRIDKPGKYPFVNHAMSLAEKGEHGFIEVK